MRVSGPEGCRWRETGKLMNGIKFNNVLHCVLAIVTFDCLECTFRRSSHSFSLSLCVRSRAVFYPEMQHNCLNIDVNWTTPCIVDSFKPRKVNSGFSLAISKGRIMNAFQFWTNAKSMWRNFRSNNINCIECTLITTYKEWKKMLIKS